MDNNTVSVLVLTYNSKLDKIMFTIKSVLCQKECLLQIVISDDGSKYNYFPEIESFFCSIGFSNYRLISHDRNQGTVNNVFSGLKLCTGKYTKLISPGDALSEESVLNGWIDFMERSDATVSFCNAIYYNFENSRFEIRKEKAHPQKFHMWDKDLLKYYLLYDDIGLGAATLCRTNELRTYMEKLKGKVMFAEDNVYRLMVASGEKFVFFEETGIYYEFGSGISTSSNPAWNERLEKDWKETNYLIFDSNNLNHITEYKLIKKQKAKNSGRITDIALAYLFMPGLLLHKIKVILNPRNTSMDYNLDYLYSLLK